MGREDVMVALMELFPQVDVRILKALAIEHEQDIHSAVDFLITEPLPLPSTPPLTPPTFEAEFGHQSFYSSKSIEEANCQRATTSDSLGHPSICSEISIPHQESNANSTHVPPLVTDLDHYMYQHEMPPQFSMEDNGLFVDNDRAVNDSLLHASPDSSEHASSRDEDAISDNRLSNYSVDNASDALYFNNDVGSFHGSCSQSTTMNRSNQFLNVDILENFINDFKSSKIALTSSMDSAVDLVKEAELHEQEAHKAKVEASEAGVDILAKAEDLKNVLAHAKNTNDMQAGEVYGEKSILATEAREFHSRLLGLAEERDKSLSIVEEMRRSLEARIAIAEAERIAAEEEKLSKEDKARKVLAEQESIMDRVVQESHKLQKQAEENSKLREFLVDRGRLIDMLQGEIAVICEDIMSLKKSVDGHVSFQEFLQSKPTSLTSSILSSHKSTMSDKTAELVRPSDCLETTMTDDLSSKSVEGLLNNQIPTLGVNDNSKLDLSNKDEQDLLDYQIPKVAVDANNKTSADDEWDFVYA